MIMSKLNLEIPEQAYELIRDQIGVIITDELRNQFVTFGDPDLDIQNIFSERFVNFDKTELPAINIIYSGGSYDNQDSLTVDGHYTYNIDVEVSNKTTDLSRGDVASRRKLHKILGKIRAIIMSPYYQTLGFQMPFIGNRKFNNMQIDTTTIQQDGINSAFGRLTLEVRVVEEAQGITPINASGYDTDVRLNETEQGFRYEFNN